jgi:bifunctional non-homologous end joining protein LigD
MVSFILPQVPILSTQPPEGSEWLYEIKHDGFRTLIAIDRDKVRAFTRNGYDWTDRYTSIIKACGAL